MSFRVLHQLVFAEASRSLEMHADQCNHVSFFKLHAWRLQILLACCGRNVFHMSVLSTKPLVAARTESNHTALKIQIEARTAKYVCFSPFGKSFVAGQAISPEIEEVVWLIDHQLIEERYPFTVMVKLL